MRPYQDAAYMKDYTINNQKANTMKTGIRTFFALMALTTIGLVSCEKTEDLNPEDIEGVYVGTFSMSSSLKSSALTLDEGDHGTAEELSTTGWTFYHTYSRTQDCLMIHSVSLNCVFSL